MNRDEESDSDDEDDECPLCMEPFEVDDRLFYPCTCGYQVCRFCWHRIRNDENGLCPACRKEYSDKPAEYCPMTMEDVQKLRAEKKQKKQQKKAKEMEQRKSLANVRVVQKNLVYVIGLPNRVSAHDVNSQGLLRKHEYFGQYGKILKIVVNRNNHYNSGPNPTVSAYITYARNEDASACVRAIDKSTLDGRILRASLGTTKYCSSFLRGISCPNPDCMYLHELGDEAVSYTKQDMLEGKHAADVSVSGAGKPLRGFGNRDPAASLPLDMQVPPQIPGGSMADSPNLVSQQVPVPTIGNINFTNQQRREAERPRDAPNNTPSPSLNDLPPGAWGSGMMPPLGMKTPDALPGEPPHARLNQQQMPLPHQGEGAPQQHGARPPAHAHAQAQA